MVDFPQGPLSPLDQQRALRADTTARVTEALAAATAPKIQDLAVKSSDKQNLLGTGASDVIAAAIKNGNNIATSDQFVQDALVMSPFDLEAKYGPDAPQAQRNLAGAQRRSYNRDVLAAGQNEAELLGDLANSAVQGGVGMASGLLGLAVSPFNPTDATKIIEEGNDVNRTLQTYQSSALNQARQEEAIASELEAADNKRQQELDAWTDGPTIAGINRVGRDAGAAINRALSSQPLANDLVGNAVGSLLSVGPTSKVLEAAKIPEAVSVPAAIGIQEGAGAYGQTVQDVLNDPEVVNSDLYKERIAAGDTPEDAKRYVANRAGQIAAPIQGVAAAATGKIVEKFEGNPFKMGSMRKLGANILKETVEEIPQTASGDLISNITQQEISNPNKDALEGVGEDVGKTVPGVIGSTTLVAAPGVGLHTIATAARESYKAGNTAISTINENLNKRNEATSPVSKEKVEEATTELAQKAPEVAQTLQDIIPETATPRQREQADRYIQNINNSMTMTPEEVAAQPFQMESNNRIEAMIRNGQRSADPNLSEDERLSSALWTLNEMSKKDALFTQDIPEALNQLEEDHPARAELNSYLQGLQFLDNHPVLRDLRDQINQMQQTKEVSPTEVTQQIASETADLATYNPAGVNPTTAAAVLYQADRGNVTLDPQQRLALLNHDALQKAAQNFVKTLETLQATPKGKTPEQVANQVIGESDDPNFPSMNDHLGMIAQALKRGDNKGARAQAQKLMKFAKHMSSKVHALNLSYDDRGTPQKYGSYGQEIQFKSPMLAKQIYAEAKAVVEVANSVAKNMPEFGIHETPIVSLRPAIRRMKATTYTVTPSSEFKDTPAPKTTPEQKAPVEASTVETETKVEVKEEPKVEEVQQVPEETVSQGTEEVSSPAQEKEQDQGLGTDSEPEVRTVETAFPNLIKDKGKSHFHEAFKLSEEGNTLAGSDTPFQTINDALANRASLVNQRGSDIRYAFDAKLGNAYRAYLSNARSIFRALNASLKDYMNGPMSKSDKRTRAEAFEQGTTFLDGIQQRMLNLLETTDKGLAYNQNLIQRAILAALHWNLNADKQGYPMDEDDISKAFSISLEEVSESLVSFMNQGVSIADAKRSLGDLITKFWGVKPTDTAPLGYTKGIPEGVAAELLTAMETAGLISLVQYEISSDKKPIRVFFNLRDAKLQAEIDALNKAPNAIADAVLVDNPDDPHIGEPPASVSETQMRNPLTKNTAQQKLVIKKAQEIPFYVNKSVMDFLDSIGEDALVDLMGGDSSLNENTPLNKNHRKSLEGVNSGIRNSFKNVMRQLAQIEGYAKKAGVNITEMPQYYEHNISRVGRLHMLGSSNPQADKIARELFVATVSQLDLRNPDHKQAFFLTLAQALGVKTELKQPDIAVAEVQQKLNGEFKLAADHVADWFNNNTKVDVNYLRNILGTDTTMKAIHALIAYAKYQKDPQNSEFEHHLSLEADGKTDGPINAIMNFTAGAFTTDWVRMMAKGGLFLGQTGKTLNDHYSTPESQGGDSADLYQTATTSLSSLLGSFRGSIEGTPVEPMMNALLRVMGATSSDLELVSDNGGNIKEIKMKRGIAKNPLTITVYGSGMKGLAGKVAGALVDRIYEAMSDVANRSKKDLGDALGVPVDQFSKDLNDLIYKAVVLTEEGEMEVRDYTPKGNKTIEGNKTIDLINFTLSPFQLQNLRNNVKALFVRHLDNSIKGMMGPSMNTTSRVQAAIQIQSLVAKDVFDKEVEKRLKAKDRPEKSSNFLSQRELNAVYKATEQYHPVVDTGTQSFFVGGTERGDLGSREFSKSLNGQLSSPAYVYSPSEAGVGGIPYMVIGTGDGQMVQNIIADNDFNNILAVFDGIELPASRIKEMSEKINKAVYDAWQMNPVQDVANSFSNFLKHNPLSLDLSDDTRAKIAKALGSEDLEEGITSLAQALQADAKSITQRKEAIAQLPLSVDHMASASSPYNSLGSSISTIEESLDSIPSIVRALNKIVSSGVIRNEVPVVSTEPMDLTSLGVLDEFNNRIISIKDLPNITGIDPSHLEVIRNASSVIGDKWRVVIGSPISLASYEVQNNPNIAPSEVGFGKTDFASKVIYIANSSSETLAHELLHAATFTKVYAFYSGGSLDAQDREAIDRIVELMGEFVPTIYNTESAPILRAGQLADAAINSRLLAANTALKQGNTQLANLEKAAAVNEFMAWVLTNRHLATLTSKVKINPILKIAQKALEAIRKLVFGGYGPKVGEDLWTNLRFNTRILLATPSQNSDLVSTSLYQHAGFGTSDRLAELRNQFLQKITSTLKGYDASEIAVRAKEVDAFKIDTAQLTESFYNHGWDLTPQEKSTFQMLVTGLGVAENINKASLSGISNIYSHVMSKLTVEDLMDDPDLNDPNDRYMAQERFNALHGVSGTKIDPKGRSTLMSSFLALAMVSPRFRNVLSKIDLPVESRTEEKSKVDQLLSDFGSNVMNNFTTWMTGQKGNNIQQALDSLTESLLAQKDDDKSFIENQWGNAINGAESYMRENIQNLSGQWDKKLRKFVNTPGVNKYASFVATMSRMALGIINDDVAEAVSESVTGILNRQAGFTTLREFFAEFVGRTNSNALIWDMITKVRTIVQQTRQQFREQLPAKITGHFSRTLSDQEWKHLFKGLAKTDIASLTDSLGVEKTLELLGSPPALAQELQKAQLRLRSLDAANELRLTKKILELAHFMNTGEASDNQLRNAYAIANLLGEGGRKTAATQELIDVIDQLVTLHALDKLPLQIKNTLSSLAQNEEEGMTFTVAYLTGQRKDELARVTNDLSRANHYKGWIPLENENGHQLTIIDDNDGTKLLPLGFTRVADYNGTQAEGTGISRGYYYAPVSGRSTYNQGILQTVRNTASGVDPVTGKTIHVLNGGVITDAAQVARITARRRSNGGFEALLPVYDALGDVVAYERQADPRQLERLNPNYNLAEMIGAWKGRQVEEAYAREFNSQLIQNLAHIWSTNQTDADQFVNLYTSKDKVIQDAVKLISPEVKAEIEKAFGGKEFWVRKDMVNDAIGFRQASVGDAWTGTTRWNPNVTKKFKELATAAFGNNAYRYLVKSEQIAQNVVASAKELIVVKSVIVPVGNMLSNMWYLAHTGVSVRDIIKGMGNKTIEVNAYIKNRARQIEIEADLRAAIIKKDVRAERKLRTEHQQLEDANRSLSIWDLIEAGEFSSISEGGPTQEDLAIANGKYTDMMESLVNKIPGPAQTLARYAWVSKDTALFKGLARATQYGDFLAKAILYDDLRKKKVSRNEAIAHVSEEFVNYNRLAGRTRNYLESVGALWFWNFKIRSTKIALRLIRRNPLRAMLSIMMPNMNLPIVGSLGSPLSDNFFAVAEDGKLGYSIGPGMGLNAPFLNPWMQIAH